MGGYNDLDKVGDDVMKDVASALLLSSVLASLEVLISKEKKHSKRARVLSKIVADAFNAMDLYPSSEKYNLVELGEEFFNTLDKHLEEVYIRGCYILGDGLVLAGKYEEGDVFVSEGVEYEVISKEEGDYKVTLANGADGMELHSSALWPEDPWLVDKEFVRWKNGDKILERKKDLKPSRELSEFMKVTLSGKRSVLRG